MHFKLPRLHRVVAGKQSVAMLLKRDMLAHGLPVLAPSVGKRSDAVFGVVERGGYHSVESLYRGAVAVDHAPFYRHILAGLHYRLLLASGCYAVDAVHYHFMLGHRRTHRRVAHEYVAELIGIRHLRPGVRHLGAVLGSAIYLAYGQTAAIGIAGEHMLPQGSGHVGVLRYIYRSVGRYLGYAAARLVGPHQLSGRYVVAVPSQEIARGRNEYGPSP